MRKIVRASARQPAALPMSARVNTGDIAPTLVAQTSEGRGGTAGPMQLIPPITDARYWETRVARNGRGGQLEPIANTLKAEAGGTGLGDAAPMVIYNIVPESGQGADLRASEVTTSTAVTVTEHAKKTDRGIRVVTSAYEVDKERGVPNPDGIRVDETSTSPTITAAGDPTERTDRGLRIVGKHRKTTAVRRLTPTECERLQGFPDGWTVVPLVPRSRKKKA